MKFIEITKAEIAAIPSNADKDVEALETVDALRAELLAFTPRLESAEFAVEGLRYRAASGELKFCYHVFGVRVGHNGAEPLTKPVTAEILKIGQKHFDHAQVRLLTMMPWYEEEQVCTLQLRLHEKQAA